MELENRGNYRVVRSIKTILDSNRSWQTEAGVWTPEMVAAEILKGVSAQVVGSGIPSATFSVPVGIRPSAIVCVLRRAAQLAGIRVDGIVKESTAAVFRYLETLKHCQFVAVFDWGGGTLDVSILEIRGGVIYERNTSAMDVAGDGLDEAIARKVQPHILKPEVSFDELLYKDRDDLVVACERAKCQLSKQPSTLIHLMRHAGSVFEITREFCEPQAIKKTVTNAVEVLATAISRAGLSVDMIDRIVVVGGSSRLWLLKRMLEDDERFAGKLSFADRPDWDVARGAAIVDSSPGSYEMAETIALVLSDGSHLELIRAGEPASQPSRSVSLALIENALSANVVLERWEGSNSERPQLATQFSIDTQGFDLEAVDLRWQVSEDLTLSLEGRSHARGINSIVRREVTPLRFGYRVSSTHHE